MNLHHHCSGHLKMWRGGERRIKGEGGKKKGGCLVVCCWGVGGWFVVGDQKKKAVPTSP